ncbi:DNA-binding GntR family transcriptional regulator [Pseudonocardia eucalypti]|nr:DNA-binding GntR family transcriptional regulator [Pseudonocardia eucalypti]
MPQHPVPDDPITRAEPLRAAVYARVVGLICSGDYEPGAAITEAALSRALNVSRTPVREALLRLEAEGVLQSALARGFTVRPLLRGETDELYPILAALESLAVTTAVPVSTATLDQLAATLAELEACTDPVRRWRLDTAWHSGIVAASGNGHLASMVTRIRTNLSRYELTYMREVRSRAAADREHREILAALGAGEGDRAAELLRDHWYGGMRLIQDWIKGRS